MASSPPLRAAPARSASPSRPARWARAARTRGTRPPPRRAGRTARGRPPICRCSSGAAGVALRPSCSTATASVLLPLLRRGSRRAGPRPCTAWGAWASTCRYDGGGLGAVAGLVERVGRAPAAAPDRPASTAPPAAGGTRPSRSPRSGRAAVRGPPAPSRKPGFFARIASYSRAASAPRPATSRLRAYCICRRGSRRAASAWRRDRPLPVAAAPEGVAVHVAVLRVVRARRHRRRQPGGGAGEVARVHQAAPLRVVGGPGARGRRRLGRSSSGCLANANSDGSGRAIGGACDA